MASLKDTNVLFESIGKIVVEFQQVEHIVAEVLATLLQMPHPTDTHRITAAMSYGQKIDLMCDLYLERSDPRWAVVDLQVVRNALKAAEEFRNTVVHSHWYVAGTQPNWMRTKANIRSKSRLNVVTGQVNLNALVEGAEVLYILKDWYIGETESLSRVTARLKALTKELSNTTKAAEIVSNLFNLQNGVTS